MVLNREQLLGLSDAKIIKVAVPQWDNAEVCLRTLTAKQRDHFERAAQDAKGLPDNVRSRMVALSLCNEDGSLLFQHNEFELLAEKSAPALDFLFTEVTKLNAIGDQEAAEEVAKNLDEIPGASSITV